MDIDERHRQIVELVRSNSAVKVAALSKRFDVTPETIRKDLVDLAERGEVIRVHGGARVRPAEKESAYQGRQSLHTGAKRAIAAAALDLVEPGATVYLDYGTTTFAIAEALVAAARPLTVVTNSLPIAGLIATSDALQGIVLGGLLRGNEGALYGPSAERALDAVHMDVGFFGAAGISVRAGITNHFPLEMAVSQRAIAQSASTVVVADSTKFDVVAVHTMARFDEIDTLITDAVPGAELSRALAEAGVTVDVVARE